MSVGIQMNTGAVARIPPVMRAYAVRAVSVTAGVRGVAIVIAIKLNIE